MPTIGTTLLPATQAGTVSTSASDSVQTQHPEFIEVHPDYIIIRDAAKGERRVKSKSTTYLPTTSGMRSAGLGDGQEGKAMYEAYLKKAVFPYLVQPAVNALVGVMHREKAVIDLPSVMEPLRDNATLQGESLQTLLVKINEAQLLVGRIGLLADVPTGSSNTLPHIVTYEAESVINWDESRRPDGRMRLDLVVCNESNWERVSGFGWEFKQKYLVLDLVPTSEIDRNFEQVQVIEEGQAVVYRSRLEIDDQELTIQEQANRQTEVTQVSVNNTLEGVTPSVRGKSLEEIPFVFIGSVDLTPDPDQIPMLGLANLSFTIYRGEADYRNTLFMQGQDTLVTIGEQAGEGDKKDRFVGASASISLPLNGDAKYIGVSGDGLPEQRTALENDYTKASELGANLLSSSRGAAKEAEETLQIRVAARTASITTVVVAGAIGLQTILRQIARWIGADPEKVVVKPNMDFVPDKFQPKELLDFMAAKNSDAPIALESIHSWLVEKGLTELTFEEELKKIEEEETKLNEMRGEEESEEMIEMRTLMLQNLRGQTQDPNQPNGPPQITQRQGNKNISSGNQGN
jgi:hypothetical protein